MRRRAGAGDSVRVVGLLFLLYVVSLPAVPPVSGAELPPGWPRTAGLRAYDATLARYVMGGGVDYDGLAKGRRGLDDYLRELAAVDSAALRARPEAEQKAFWINAYNALTLDLVLRNLHGADGKGPRLKSIRDIPDAFSRPRWVVAGAPRSLDGIERGILWERFHEPRVHFALVCASRSCPALRPRAYAAESLNDELDQAARVFLADTTRNLVCMPVDTLRFSRIFEWYERDFREATPEITPQPFLPLGPRLGPLLAYLASRHYLPEETTQILRKLRHASVGIEFLPYDWSLNEAPSRR
jgi:hypothetical protein